KAVADACAARTGVIEKVRRSLYIRDSRVPSSGAVEKIRFAGVRNLYVTSSGAVRKMYLAGPLSRKSLEPRIIRDAHTAYGERGVADGDGIGIRSSRGEDDAVHLGVLRYRDVGHIGKIKRCNIR